MPPIKANLDPRADKAKAAKNAKPAKDNAAKVKAAGAVAALLVAGVLLAHHFGVIQLWGGPPPEEPLPPEEVAQMEATAKKHQQAMEAEIKSGKAVQVGE